MSGEDPGKKPLEGNSVGDDKGNSVLELLTTPHFLLPALFVIIAVGIGYSVYWWPPAGSVAPIPEPVGEKRLHVATASDLAGVVSRQKGGEASARPLFKGASVAEGDRIVLSKSARLILSMPGGPMFIIIGEAELCMGANGIRLEKGRVLAENRRPATTAKVETSLMTASLGSGRYLVELKPQAGGVVVALDGNLQIRTGTRVFTARPSQELRCQRIGELTPPTKLGRKALKRRLAAYGR